MDFDLNNTIGSHLDEGGSYFTLTINLTGVFKTTRLRELTGNSLDGACHPFLPLIKTGEEMYIGIGLGRMRNERDWTQEKLAELSDLGYRSVQNIEYNKTSPTGSSICRIAQAFEMEHWEFLKNISDEIIYKPRKQKAMKKSVPSRNSTSYE